MKKTWRTSLKQDSGFVYPLILLILMLWTLFIFIKVALETISGFVSNCTAIKVVFAAVGMAAANTMICLTSPSTGRISANPDRKSVV